ncbi:ATPase, T2SS/T4P/T4SS family [Sodalis sp. dw_96]|uniref:ATPase, T2SS/T4P/T4SS family n=1 Tax=Sodalis sp. dw_96 TaxID=2719794 RepID=UPI001BD5457C|nr:ATPase, T2SS/T4P/T4SS family [Sodalis sp. dw_96]
MIVAYDNPPQLEDYIEGLLGEAADHRASDIHIEPCPSSDYRVRFRIDGLLRQHANCAPGLAARLVVGLKMRAGMDIAERRLPQDGQFTFGKPDSGYSCRIATLPTLCGEKLVLRLLQRETNRLTLENLGMSVSLRRQFLRRLHQPQGLVLLTGPTGSGKTLTLYSAIQAMDRQRLNICSVEDPVEIPLADIAQCQVNRKAQLDFPRLLRALLRQDPDVIMVGEIRDAETAAIAINAAQTGHLVLSTLHTLTAADTLQRLRQLGMDPARIRPVLRLVMAQRLVRRLCRACRRQTAPGTTHRRGDFTSRPSWRAMGCDQCHEGYVGRHGLFHLLPGESLSDSAPVETGRQKRLCGLWQAGLTLVDQGITTVAELRRVLGEPA